MRYGALDARPLPPSRPAVADRAPAPCTAPSRTPPERGGAKRAQVLTHDYRLAPHSTPLANPPYFGDFPSQHHAGGAASVPGGFWLVTKARAVPTARAAGAAELTERRATRSSDAEAEETGDGSKEPSPLPASSRAKRPEREKEPEVEGHLFMAASPHRHFFPRRSKHRRSSGPCGCSRAPRGKGCRAGPRRAARRPRPVERQAPITANHGMKIATILMRFANELVVEDDVREVGGSAILCHEGMRKTPPRLYRATSASGSASGSLPRQMRFGFRHPGSRRGRSSCPGNRRP